MDPIWGAVVKGGFALVGPIAKAAALEWARRDPEAPEAAPASLDREMTEALDVLLGVSAQPHEALLNPVKAVLSDVPKLFSDPAIRDWMRQASSRAGVQRVVLAAMNADSDTIEGEANAALAEALKTLGSDVDVGAAASAFSYAVAFVSISLTRHLTVGERIIAGKVEVTQGMIASLQTDVRRLANRAETPGGQALWDTMARTTIEALRQGRFYLDPETAAAKAKALGERLATGDLSGVSDGLRRRGLALCARWRVHHATEDDLAPWLEIAGPELEETRIVRAFLAAKSDEAAGLDALGPIDTPALRMVAMQIRARSHGSGEVVAWCDAAGISLADLDADGRSVLLQHLAIAENWPRAFDGIEALSRPDFETTPILHKLAGHLLAASASAPVFRRAVLQGQPLLHGADFPFDDTAAGLTARDRAEDHFRQAAVAARAAGSQSGANYLSSWALLLAMRNPARRAVAEAELRATLDDPEAGASVVPLALSFGIAINREAVEANLARREALKPKGDVELATARFALVQRQGGVEASLAYLARHRNLMSAHIAPEYMVQLDVQLLRAANRSGEAADRLKAVRDQIPPELVGRLEAFIAQDTKAEVADLEKRFQEAPDAASRGSLLEALTPEGYSDRVVDLWLDQVRETRARDAAETLVRYLEHHGRADRAEEALAAAGDLLAGSFVLRAAQAWNDYRQGRFNEAAEALEALRAERTDLNDRALRVNLLIDSGRWPELIGLVEDEWAARGERSAQDLLRAAELASRVGSPRVLELLEEAAAREPEDPNILIASYSLAVRAGQDEAAKANAWLEAAIRLSDETGPVQQTSLKELLAQQPEWDRSVETIWNHLRDGEVPLRMAAPLLRRPALELHLAAMIMNRRERDPRKRAVIPAFSGIRASPDLTAGTIGLDVTALINLEMCGVLTELVARGGIHIAHDALRCLFDDRQAMAFHQPSRIAEAKALLQDLMAGQIRIFEPSVAANAKLAGDIGGTAGAMLEAAQATPDRARAVRVGPATRLESLGDEFADLSAFNSVLVSGTTLTGAVAASGRLTQGEEAVARAYLARVSDRPWSDDECLPAGVELLVDDVSLSHLRSMGILNALQASGHNILVSPRQKDEARALLALESRRVEIEAVIEGLRLKLETAIASGAVVACSNDSRSEDDAEGFVRCLFNLSERVDVVVIDDRYFNQLRAIDHGTGATPIWTSLDVLNLLEAEGRLSRERRDAARTLLRQCGLIVFPVEEAELRAQIFAGSEDGEGRLRETGELRAFRENIALMQLRGWLRLPKESAWAIQLSAMVIRLITEQWTEDVPDATARARSDWLLERIDHRNWAEMIGHQDGSQMAANGLSWQLVKLMLAAPTDSGARARFDAWLEGHVEALKSYDRAAYDWMIETLRNLAVRHQQGED